MSTDLRNSIYLWAGAIALAGLFWATARFDLLADAPPWLEWGWIIALIGSGLIGAVRFLWGLWQRRASNPRHPNRA